MEKSPSIVNIAKALQVFHVKVGKIRKNANNPFFKSKYADLSHILEEIEEPLNEAGLVLSQLPTGINGLTTMLIHAESGEYLQSEYFLQPVKNDPQATGSVISYARRYAITAILSLNIDDDDANTATHGAATPQQAATSAEKTANQMDLDPKGNPKKWLNQGTKEYEGTVKKLQEGKTSLSTVSQYFKLNKEVRAELQQYEKKS